MLPTFQRALQRRTAIVAGVRLPPLTLAQAYCLHAWGSPLVSGARINLPDFALALWTCTHPCWPFHKFTDAVCRGKPDAWLTRLGKRYDVRRFNDDAAALIEHIKWHCRTPPRFFKTDHTPAGSSAPWPMVIAVQVMPLIGERRTWTEPVPLILAYKIALDNAAGDTTWKTEAESETGYADGCDTQSDK